MRKRLRKLGIKPKTFFLSEKRKKNMKSLLNLLQKPADASVEDFKRTMGCLTWFLPIGKNRNLEAVKLIHGWFCNGSIPLMSYQVL